jgi:hypothetical protein
VTFTLAGTVLGFNQALFAVQLAHSLIIDAARVSILSITAGSILVSVEIADGPSNEPSAAAVLATLRATTATQLQALFPDGSPFQLLAIVPEGTTTRPPTVAAASVKDSVADVARVFRKPTADEVRNLVGWQTVLGSVVGSCAAVGLVALAWFCWRRKRGKVVHRTSVRNSAEIDPKYLSTTDESSPAEDAGAGPARHGAGSTRIAMIEPLDRIVPPQPEPPRFVPRPPAELPPIKVVRPMPFTPGNELALTPRSVSVTPPTSRPQPRIQPMTPTYVPLMAGARATDAPQQVDVLGASALALPRRSRVVDDSAAADVSSVAPSRTGIRSDYGRQPRWNDGRGADRP